MLIPFILFTLIDGNPFSSDDSEQDVDYIPEDDDSSSDSSESMQETDMDIGPIQDYPENAIPPTRPTGRKRVRQPENWKRERAKKLRNEGQKYVSRNNKLHENRCMREHIHQCRYNCNTQISDENRQTIFNDFWKLGSWELQTSFLNGAIELEPVKRKKLTAIYSKGVSCSYKLSGMRVCKEFFMRTLDVTNKRLQNVVEKKKTAISGVSFRDQRGRKEPSNKISQERIDSIKEHINKFPHYTSHYSRRDNPNRKYLDPRLNLKLMYDLYVTFCRDEKQVEPVKESFYRHIFNTQFNLSFHRPNTDTCVTCDKLQIIIDHGQEQEAKEQASLQKDLHIHKAEVARKAKNDCHNINDESQVAICFDLQKTMPTPYVTSSKAYYCRQLWTYNLCIHNLATGNANMYTWHEGQASRGCNAIVSCLLKFITTLPPHVKHLTAFTDNCGGQNKSHIIVKFWLYIVRNTHIESVDHRFLISGHSYNECDQDFGLIEKKKKQCKRDLYIPEHWSELIASSCRKFAVVQMQDEDFINLNSLTPYFKKTVPGIRAMHWLHFKKENPYTLFYRTNTGNELEDFMTLQMKSNRAGRIAVTLPELSIETEKPKLKFAKFSNLMELLPFVPPIYHDFFKDLPHETPGRTASHLNEAEEEDEPDQLYDTDDD